MVVMSRTAARFSRPWLAATPAAPAAAVPIKGTPAHEAVTASNSNVYCHHVLAGPADAGNAPRSDVDNRNARRVETGVDLMVPDVSDHVGAGAAPGSAASGGAEPASRTTPPMATANPMTAQPV
jgi:hypothetical protein